MPEIPLPSEEPMVPEVTPPPPRPMVEAPLALLDDALTKYRMDLEQDLDGAQGRHGFTLFHSLAPEEKVALIERLGFKPQDGIDHYNLGCVAAGQENFKAAVSHFEKAVDGDPQWIEALHNLALALERAGRKTKAREAWGRCLEACGAGAARAAVEAHLAELG